MISRIIFIFFLFLISFGASSASLYEVFTENGKQGLKDAYGKVVIPPQFDALGWTNTGNEVKNNFIGFLKNDRWGLLSTSNEILHPATLDAIYDATTNYIVAGKKQVNGRYKKGLINYDGKIIISYSYNYLKTFDTNIIAVRDKHYGLLNFQEKEVIPFKYTNIEHVGDLRWMVWDENLKGAVFTSKGSKLTDFTIDSIEHFHSGVAIAWKAHLAGLADRNGEWLLPAKYKSISIKKGVVSGEPYASYSIFKDDKAFQLQLDSIKSSQDYLIAFASGVQWILDKKLNKISPTGSDIKIWNNKAAIKEGNFYRIFDLDKQVYSNNSLYKDVVFLSEEIFMGIENQIGSNTWSLFKIGSQNPILSGIGEVELNEEGIKIKKRQFWGFYSYKGVEVLTPVYDEIKAIKGDRFLVEFHKDYGIINSDEEWLVAPLQSRRYEDGGWVRHQILDFNANHYISFDGKNYNLYGFSGKRIYFSSYPLNLKINFVEERMDKGQSKRINFKGRSIQSVFGESGYQEVLPLKEGLIGIYHQGMFGFIDPQNRLLISNRYEGIQSFSGGVAGVKIRGKWGAIDQFERLVVQPLYDSIGDFIEDLAIVRINDNYGIVDSSGKLVLAVEYDALRLLNDNFLLIEKEGKAGVINKKGKMIMWPKFDNINYHNGFFIVSKNGQYGLHDQEGLAVLPPGYDQIIPFKKGDFLVGKKEENKQITLP